MQKANKFQLPRPLNNGAAAVRRWSAVQRVLHPNRVNLYRHDDRRAQ